MICSHRILKNGTESVPTTSFCVGDDNTTGKETCQKSKPWTVLTTQEQARGLDPPRKQLPVDPEWQPFNVKVKEEPVEHVPEHVPEHGQVKTEPAGETMTKDSESAYIKQEWGIFNCVKVKEEANDDDLLSHDVADDMKTRRKKGKKKRRKNSSASEDGQGSEASPGPLEMSEETLSATPFTEGGFALIWSGVKAMYGVNKGRVAFEVKLTENRDVHHLPAEEFCPNVLRVGWSAKGTSLQLGEEPRSFGYGGTGKAATERTFVDYGQQFTAGDVITAYMKSDLEEEALFPHVFTKNVVFECNFGASEPWFPLKEGFMFIDQVPLEERVRGTSPPAKKSDCEVIVMIGLPGSGKTTWAEKLKADKPDRMYNILGTNLIMNKMRVMGLPRKRNYAGRWDVLIDKSTECFNTLLEVAAGEERNYIIDQTNVSESDRRSLLQPFGDFQCRAVVIVPTEKDYVTRLELQRKGEGKDIPELDILKMKGEFTLPEEGVLFDSVDYVEQDIKTTKDLLEEYNKEGKDNLPPPPKRAKISDRHGWVDVYRGGGWVEPRLGVLTRDNFIGFDEERECSHVGGDWDYSRFNVEWEDTRFRCVDERWKYRDFRGFGDGRDYNYHRGVLDGGDDESPRRRDDVWQNGRFRGFDEGFQTGFKEECDDKRYRGGCFDGRWQENHLRRINGGRGDNYIKGLGKEYENDSHR